MLAVTGDSPSVAREELAGAQRVALEVGFPWQSVTTQEVLDPRYQANDGHRCYFCKSELYSVLEQLRQARGYDAIFDGFNVDDLSDFRPGLKAGQEHRVVSPLKAAGLGKDAIRTLARAWNLSNADKPSSPCLASRIAYHMTVTPERLAQVEMAESALHRLGLQAVRVRHHDRIARIEVTIEDMPQVLAHRDTIVQAVQEAGFSFVTLDLSGLRSGSLNTLL
jgi:uncharacterized protein